MYNVVISFKILKWTDRESMKDLILITEPNVNVITWNALWLECQKRQIAEL